MPKNPEIELIERKTENGMLPGIDDVGRSREEREEAQMDERLDERRKAARARMLKSGRIAVSAKAPKIECAIRNLSDTGACLQVHSGTFGIPREFELQLDGGLRHPCKVIWRTESRLGVSFS